jgi:precorrin-6A/cobalt-precorrin-6A reductase
MRLLILGGTSEASALATALARRSDIQAMLSLAGRTAAPERPPISHRIGGFGGVAGLSDYLALERFDAVVDATHPFAAQMSRHAAEACRARAVPLAAFTRPPWHPAEGDRWIEVPDMEAAVAALGDAPRRVFLTVGRLSLPAFAAAPQHDYVIRTIDVPDGLARLPHHRLVQARGPFDARAEEDLMRREAIEVLVTKNSGGAATEAKMAAASRLGLPVIVVQRPARPDGVAVLHDLQAVLDWIEAHRPPPYDRGV